MRNAEKWKPKRFTRDKKNRIIGTHMHKIIGNAYEPIIRKYSKGILADIGCGDVPYYHFYKENIVDNICIDWPNSNLEASFLDYNVDLNKGLDFLKDKSIDTVLCTDVLEHIHRPELLFSEMTRILAPNGYLILTVPFLYWVHESPHDYHRYTHYKLREFCENNKLKVVELNIYGGLPEIIYDLIYKGYWYYNFPLRKLFYFFLKGVGYFLSKRRYVKKLSNISKETFPMGYILVATKE
jgi:SAM-dependent methyltransferase